MRINKYLASAGVASRRGADDIIKHGRVKVNGKIVTELGMDITEKDFVEVDNNPIIGAEEKVYIALNKPKGYITTMRDQFNRPCVMELVSEVPARVFPVGRLDYATSGLLILTNDGDFANKMAHPSHEVYKTYIAKVLNFPTESDVIKLKTGVELDDGITAPANVEVLKKYSNCTDIKLSIREGRNRQVRRMFESLGYKVVDLKRISVGNILLGNLPLGKWRNLTEREIKPFK